MEKDLLLRPFFLYICIIMTETHPINSMGFAKPESETRIIVAMSGGVDSSVTAALLKDQGYDVVGITLQLYDHGEAIQKKGACCAGQDIYDAKRVAEMIDIPHYVLNYESRFHDGVMQDFADSYLRGETPIPCVRCNQTVKFKDLLETARSLGGDALATGHYIRRVVNDAGQAELHRAVDPTKDQSYFLFATTQDQLDYLRFPLGGNNKEETRALAEKYGLVVADKPDSQDICFVPGGSYAKVVERLRPGAVKGGDIIHMDGRKLGRHDGIIHYTIGQRRGLGIGGGYEGKGENTDPLYVIAVDADNNTVIVGPKEALAKNVIYIKETNWLGPQIDAEGLSCQVKIRSVSCPVTGHVYQNSDNDFYVVTDEPQFGVAAGQACVLYDGERVLGGGWICDSAYQENARAA